MNADTWNRQHPPGTRVRFQWKAGEVVEVVTTGRAWSLSTGRAVVPIKGIRGSVPVDDLVVIKEAAA